MDEKPEDIAERVLNLILSQAIEDEASHVHLEPGTEKSRVRFRVPNGLRVVMEPPANIHGSLINRVKMMADLDVVERRVPQSHSIELTLQRASRPEPDRFQVQVSTIPVAGGESAVLEIRALDRDIPPLEDLGLSGETVDTLDKLMQQGRGLIMVVGQLGSGRSTAIRSMVARWLDKAEEHQRGSIILADDRNASEDFDFPPEVQHLWLRPKIGLTVSNLAVALMKHDTDLLTLPAIYLEQGTAANVLELAHQRTLVLARNRSWNAATSFPPRRWNAIPWHHLGETLLGILALRRLPRLCGECREIEEREEIVEQLPPGTYYRGVGCESCHGLGVDGWLSLSELLVMNPALRRMVSAWEVNQAKELAAAGGYKTFAESALELVQAGELQARDYLTMRHKYREYE